jgi:hypothetical protein
MYLCIEYPRLTRVSHTILSTGYPTLYVLDCQIPSSSLGVPHLNSFPFPLFPLPNLLHFLKLFLLLLFPLPFLQPYILTIPFAQRPILRLPLLSALSFLGLPFPLRDFHSFHYHLECHFSQAEEPCLPTFSRNLPQNSFDVVIESLIQPDTLSIDFSFTKPTY